MSALHTAGSGVCAWDLRIKGTAFAYFKQSPRRKTDETFKGHSSLVLSKPSGIKEGFPEEVAPEKIEDKTEQNNSKRLTNTYCQLHAAIFSS